MRRGWYFCILLRRSSDGVVVGLGEPNKSQSGDLRQRYRRGGTGILYGYQILAMAKWYQEDA